MRPWLVLVEEEWQNIHTLLHGAVVFQLCDASSLTIGHMPSSERDEQDAQVAALEPILRELLGLTTLRCPVFHRIHKQPRVTQRIDHMRAMILEIYECRRDKGLIGFAARRHEHTLLPKPVVDA